MRPNRLALLPAAGGATVLAGAMVVVPGQPAEASIPQPQLEIPLADSADHNYCFAPSVDPADYNLHHDALGKLDDVSDISRVFVPQCDASTDVIFERDDGLPYLGVTECETWSPGAVGVVCDRFRVTINNAVHYQFANADQKTYIFNLRATVCHEAGHTVGLPHTDDGDPDSIQWGCMSSAWVTDINYKYWEYAPAHVQAINDYY
jgi:hypothetical protein